MCDRGDSTHTKGSTYCLLTIENLIIIKICLILFSFSHQDIASNKAPKPNLQSSFSKIYIYSFIFYKIFSYICIKYSRESRLENPTIKSQQLLSYKSLQKRTHTSLPSHKNQSSINSDQIVWVSSIQEHVLYAGLF